MNKTIITTDLKTNDIIVKKGETRIITAVLTKGWKTPREIKITLEGENASAIFLAVIIGKNKENFPLKTVAIHNAPNTKARFFIRSVMADQSQVDYHGHIKIQSKAQLTDTYLSHHSLSMSKEAKIKTLPSMEVKANNVKAGHAATIGKPDPETLFYLKTRGLSEKDAKELLIKSFLQSDLSNIHDEETREKISTEIIKSI